MLVVMVGENVVEGVKVKMKKVVKVFITLTTSLTLITSTTLFLQLRDPCWGVLAGYDAART